MKTVKLTDFLTTEQIKRAVKLKSAKDICDQIVQPNIAAINQKLGQENDPLFLAYLVLYVIERAKTPS